MAARDILKGKLVHVTKSNELEKITLKGVAGCVGIIDEDKKIAYMFTIDAARNRMKELSPAKFIRAIKLYTAAENKLTSKGYKVRYINDW